MKKYIFYFLIILLLTNCSIEKRDWRNAINQNNIQVFEQFFRKYPQSKFKDSASIKIEELCYKAAKEQDNVQAYQQFINCYPKSIFNDSVINRIRQIEFIEIINKKDTLELKKFICNYPDASVLNDYKIKQSTSIISQPKNANKGCKITLKELNANAFTYVLTIQPKTFFNPDLGFDATVHIVKGDLIVTKSNNTYRYESSSEGTILSIIINKKNYLKLNAEYIEIMPNLLINLDNSEFIITGKDSVVLKRDVSQNKFYNKKGNAYLFKL